MVGMVTDGYAGCQWWTAAFYCSEEEVMRRMGFDSWSKPQSPGGFGHPMKRVHETGAMLYVGNNAETQPVVLNASGTVCESWASELMDWTFELNGWATRLDLAVDVGPADQARRRLMQLRRDYRAGRVMTTMRRDSVEYVHSDGETGGDTLYLGGKYSDLRLRCYDVRGPLRLEWQYRPAGREVGQIVVENVRAKGPFAMWRGITRQRLMFKHDWYCH